MKLCWLLSVVMALAMLTMFSLMIYFDWWSFDAKKFPCNTQRTPILLISMDGFRHDYLELARARGHKLPNFERLLRGGTRAMHSKNVYPTITAPNHYSLLTGVHPETHGIVLNYFIDRPMRNATWSLGSQRDQQDTRFYGDAWPPPIWHTAQRQGRRVGNILWPTTDYQLGWDQPYLMQGQYSYLNLYEQMDFMKRVNLSLFWLGEGQRRFQYNLDLLLLYFPEPDDTGHAYGPNSTQVALKVKQLDGVLGALMDGLLGADTPKQEATAENSTAQNSGKRLIDGEVNIILTSDHGMSQMSVDRIIALDDYVPRAWYKQTMLLTLVTLYPTPGFEKELYDTLKYNSSERMQVFWRHEVPVSLHYSKDNGRIPPLILIPDPGWMIMQEMPKSTIAGDHGYNNSFIDSQPFFIAHGPSFRRNHTVEEVHALDIYPLMCHLMKISPNPHNGSLSRISKLILNNSPSSQTKLDNSEKSRIADMTMMTWLLIWLIMIGVFVYVLKKLQNKLSKYDDFNALEFFRKFAITGSNKKSAV